MGEPTAILAVNSLDRFVTDQSFRTRGFYATWPANSNQITWVGPFVPEETPIVGSEAAPHLVAEGLPLGTIITAYNPITHIATINKTTTLATLSAIETLWGYFVKVGPYSNFLKQLYDDGMPFGNNFTLQSQSSYIYGYIRKIIVSQIQLQYNIPTVNKGLNDTFYIVNATNGGAYKITIPHGFYYADELAAIMQVLIRTSTLITDMSVLFVPRDGFVFSSATEQFYFPSYLELQVDDPYLSDLDVTNVLKTYRMLGLGLKNATAASIQASFDYPNFLYTPYIDIYSDTLTNYQNIKDTNTSIPNQKGLLARIYVSGTGQIQTTGSVSALGTSPFVMTSDLNSPKVIRWTPDVTVTTIDIQLRDQYGDLIPGYEDGFSTEFQMTLLCSEGE